MKKQYEQTFKNRAVQKALSRGRQTTMQEIADELGVDKSTIGRWIRESNAKTGGGSKTESKQEKRPQDWSQAERLEALLNCHGLNDTERSSWCRQHGLYPHQIEQWQSEFISGAALTQRRSEQGQVRQLKAENKQLKQELQRKEKALAETAALLVLKKKVQCLLENDEDR